MDGTGLVAGGVAPSDIAESDGITPRHVLKTIDTGQTSRAPAGRRAGGMDPAYGLVANRL
jgi:hypothetical protein